MLPLIENLDIKFTVKDNSVKVDSSGALFVTVDATHAGFINRNYYRYNPSAMRDGTKSWTYPFKKWVLRNHNDEGEPLGQVVGARYIGDNLKGFIQLDLLVTDPDAIVKIIDGRYRTVSTHGLPSTPRSYVKCSICGTDLASIKSDSQFCGHRRGKQYEDEDTGVVKLCFWDIGELDYNEVSFVNFPADRSDDHVAAVTSFKFLDTEGEVQINTNDTTEYKGVFMPVSTLWTPQSHLDMVIAAVMPDINPEFIANRSLWDSITGVSEVARVESYVKAGGRFTSEITDEIISKALDTKKIVSADPVLWDTVVSDNLLTKFKDYAKLGGTFDEPEATNIPAVADAVEFNSVKNSILLLDSMLPAIADSTSKYLTDFAKDDKSKKHRHVLWTNEAGNGSTDYVLGHWHEVVNNAIEPNKVSAWDPKAERYVTRDGHAHKIAGDSIATIDTSESKTEFNMTLTADKDTRIELGSVDQAVLAMYLLIHDTVFDHSQAITSIKDALKQAGMEQVDELYDAYSIMADLRINI